VVAEIARVDNGYLQCLWLRSQTLCVPKWPGPLHLIALLLTLHAQLARLSATLVIPPPHWPAAAWRRCHDGGMSGA
jgi:hypothetical protein